MMNTKLCLAAVGYLLHGECTAPVDSVNFVQQVPNLGGLSKEGDACNGENAMRQAIEAVKDIEDVEERNRQAYKKSLEISSACLEKVAAKANNIAQEHSHTEITTDGELLRWKAEAAAKKADAAAVTAMKEADASTAAYNAAKKDADFEKKVENGMQSDYDDLKAMYIEVVSLKERAKQLRLLVGDKTGLEKVLLERLDEKRSEHNTLKSEVNHLTADRNNETRREERAQAAAEDAGIKKGVYQAELKDLEESIADLITKSEQTSEEIDSDKRVAADEQEDAVDAKNRQGATQQLADGFKAAEEKLGKMVASLSKQMEDVNTREKKIVDRLHEVNKWTSAKKLGEATTKVNSQMNTFVNAQEESMKAEMMTEVVEAQYQANRQAAEKLNVQARESIDETQEAEDNKQAASEAHINAVDRQEEAKELIDALGKDSDGK
jgi:hypothetical protein